MSPDRDEASAAAAAEASGDTEHTPRGAAAFCSTSAPDAQVAASGLSQLQRRILQLALTVNMHTQGGVARVKAGLPVDLRSPLALWVLGNAVLAKSAHGFFTHSAATRSAKASITRATTRLIERGLLTIVSAPGYFPESGYVLTAQGLCAAGAEPMRIPQLVQACELFGITHKPNYDACNYVYKRGPDDGTPQWRWNEARARKAALIDELQREHPNGYQRAGDEDLVAVEKRPPIGNRGRSVTVEERLPTSCRRDGGSRCSTEGNAP